MTYYATDTETLSLGFTLPKGTDLIKTGDDAISQNARSAAGGINAAIRMLDNLTATATTLDYGQPATATVTGPMANKTITIGIPKGMPQDVGQQLVTEAQTAATQSTASAADAAAAVTLAQQAQAAAYNVPDVAMRDIISNGISETAGALRFRNTVLEARDYGVVGDGVTDDTAAIRSLFQAAALWTSNAKTGQKATIHFPAGEFIITANNVFADLTTASNIGLNVVGAGMSATRFKLVTGGAPMWFYDNGTTRRWNYVTISDCAFTTDGPSGAGVTEASQHGGFAKITSTGHEQFFKFFRCHFVGPWDTLIQTEGTGNADQIGLFACKVQDVYGHVMYINNPQSVIHEWYNVTATRLYGHGFTVGPNGGGDVKLVGGSWILMGIAADTTPRYLFNVPTAGSGIGGGNGTFAAWGIKTETHLPHMRLAITPPASEVRVSFRDCNLWTTAPAVDSTYSPVHVGRRGHVIFDGCTLPGNFAAVLTGPTLAQTTQDGDTLLQITNSTVPPALSDRVTFTASTYPRAIASGCRTFAHVGTPQGVDFDLGWQVATLAGPSPMAKRVLIRSAGRGWPTPAGTSEWVTTLPKDAMISRILVRRPGQGSASETYQLHVGTDDKATVFASSTLAAPADLHVIDMEPWIDTSTTPSARTLRLWATGTAAAAGAQGMPAWIEYL